MHKRVLFGIAAWLLGAGTATTASLFAVSLLGEGITPATVQLLSPAAVDRALASEPGETLQERTVRSAPAGTPGEIGGLTLPPGESGASPGPAPSSPAARATGSADDPGPTTTALTSQGGDAVASCLPAGAYLNSWTPLLGYEVSAVDRGPSETARVTFVSAQKAVTMLVSCSDGVPSAATHTGEGGGD